MVHSNCPYVVHRSFGGGNVVYHCEVFGGLLDFCDTVSKDYQSCLWYMMIEERKKLCFLLPFFDREGEEF